MRHSHQPQRQLMTEQSLVSVTAGALAPPLHRTSPSQARLLGCALQGLLRGSAAPQLLAQPQGCPRVKNQQGLVSSAQVPGCPLLRAAHRLRQALDLLRRRPAQSLRPSAPFFGRGRGAPRTTCGRAELTARGRLANLHCQRRPGLATRPRPINAIKAAAQRIIIEYSYSYRYYSPYSYAQLN